MITSVKQMRTNLVTAMVLFLVHACFAVLPDADFGGRVVFGMKGDFDSFNEFNASDADALQVINNMLFMQLTRLNANLDFVPYLATEWTFENGGKSLTYTLREDVSWSDGQPTTAEDVLFTYEMSIHPDVAYPASSRFDMTEQVEVLDPYRIRFTFKKAYPDALFDTQIPILPKHVLEAIPPAEIAQSDFNRKPIGNGPFRLVEWKANRHAIFAANTEFAPGRPYLDQVVFTVVPDESVLLTNLLTGAIDVVPSLSSQDFQRIASDPSVEGLKYDGKEYTFLAWNCANPVFTSGIRRALTHCIDKTELIATLMDGYAVPARGPLMPFTWAFDEAMEDLAFDPAAAGQLFSEEGWSDTDGDGFLDRADEAFRISILTNAGSQLHRDMAVMVQAQLRKAGIQASVEVVDFNLLIERVFVDKDFDVLLSGWETDFSVNPTDLYHSRAIEEGYNFVSYGNPRVDALLEQGREIADRSRARPVWKEFQRLILEEAPYTFLFLRDKLAGYRLRVRNIKMDVRGFLSSIQEWWIPEEAH